jgi:hypothetical protein
MRSAVAVWLGWAHGRTQKNTTGLGGGWRSNEGRDAGQAWQRSWVVWEGVG